MCGGDEGRYGRGGDLSGVLRCIACLLPELVSSQGIYGVELTLEEVEAPFSYAEGNRFVDKSFLRGRPFARTFRGGRTTGCGVSSMTAGSGSTGSILVRSIMPIRPGSGAP